MNLKSTEVQTMSEVTIKRLLGDRILAKRIHEKMGEGIIEIPDKAREKCQRAKVLMVGPGAYDSEGNRIPMPVKVGDIVIFSNHTDTDIPGMEKDVVMFNTRHILAVEDGDAAADQTDEG